MRKRKVELTWLLGYDCIHNQYLYFLILQGNYRICYNFIKFIFAQEFII